MGSRSGDQASCRPVLVIDDDQGIREIMVEVLELNGVPVASASDGLAALEQLRAGLRPSLVILDLMMPGMNGWETYAALRREPSWRDFPVAVLTGDGRVAEKASELGVREFLGKPVELDSLLAVVNRYCQPEEPGQAEPGQAGR